MHAALLTLFAGFASSGVQAGFSSEQTAAEPEKPRLNCAAGPG